MAIEIKVPELPESVADGTIATWHVKKGDKVTRDQNLVDIETDKVVLEVVAEADGVIGEINAEEGDTVESKAVIGTIVEGDGEAAGSDDDADDAEDAEADSADDSDEEAEDEGAEASGESI
ncbi:MAG: dihydrolipoamide succinyltransferase, partial [Gammaproteobacteria bacterium]|nr:dihydrolipoamide succinyltransferase [Gammaproteobacteria bacterium]